MRIHITAVASTLGDYCEIESWIRAKYHIKKPTSDVMLRGTISHHLLEVIEGGLKISQCGSLEEIKDCLSAALLDEYIKFKNDNKDSNFNPIEAEILDYIECLAYKFTSRYYKLGVYDKTYKSKWITEERLQTTIEYDGNPVTISGRIDRYKLISMTKCVVNDYKLSVNPVINQSMQIQLDGYAFLIKKELGIDNVMGEIEFPLYQIIEHYIPDPNQFENVYIPLFIDTMDRELIPPYYAPRKSCNYCQDEVRKKCLELRPK